MLPHMTSGLHGWLPVMACYMFDFREAGLPGQLVFLALHALGHQAYPFCSRLHIKATTHM